MPTDDNIRRIVRSLIPPAESNAAGRTGTGECGDMAETAQGESEAIEAAIEAGKIAIANLPPYATAHEASQAAIRAAAPGLIAAGREMAATTITAGYDSYESVTAEAEGLWLEALGELGDEYSVEEFDAAIQRRPYRIARGGTP